MVIGDSLIITWRQLDELKLSSRSVVLKLGSTEPQGFGEAVAGVRLRSE